MTAINAVTLARRPALGVPPPTLCIDFVAGQSTGIGLTRGSDGTWIDGNGVLRTAGNGLFRHDHDLASPNRRLGWLLEPTRTNNALHSSDLTNAAWVKTNTTALKDATGLDNVANSASTLTAAANAGTCLQTVTIASAAFTYSVYVKRKTGAGTVEITDNNLAAATDITASLSSTAWTRFDLTRTQANPVFGFRLGTSGDEIEVDYNQLENGAFPTSGIATTTVAVARADEFGQVTDIDWFSAAQWTLLSEIHVPAVGSTFFTVFSLDDGTLDNRIELALTGGNRPRLTISTGGVLQTDLFYTGQDFTDGDTKTIVIAGNTNDVAMVVGSGSVQTDTVVTLPTSIDNLGIGARSNVANITPTNLHFRRFAYWNRSPLNHVVRALAA